MPRFRAVLFDLDGTLVDEKSSWEWVHEHFGVDNAHNVEAYLAGKLDDAAFIASDIALWSQANGGPVHLSQVEGILADAPIMRGAHELLEVLHEAGVRTAIVSGGIDVLADRVGKELGIEHVVANSLNVDRQGRLMGTGVCRVKLLDKHAPSLAALAHLRVPAGEAAGVGNSRFDVGMFRAAGYGVAFASLDDDVRFGADVVVEGRDLRKVIPALLEDA